MTRWMLLSALLLATLPGCKTPDPAEVRREHAEAELALWAERAAAPEGPLDLDRALALAIENNLDLQVLRMQRELAAEDSSARRLAMLPRLTAEGELSYRSRKRISSSEGADTGRESLEPSFSSERFERSGGLELVWGALDFGVAYFRSRQAIHAETIAESQQQSARQQLALDVTRWYFIALVADRAVAESKELLGRLAEREATIKRQVAEQQISAYAGLGAQETMMLARIRLAQMEREQKKAHARLRSLLGLAQGPQLQLTPGQLEEAVPGLLGVEELEREALASHPQLTEQDMQGLIAAEQVKIAIASLLPSPAAFLGLQADGNPFLRHKVWAEAGVRVSWDLLSLPRKWKELGAARTAAELRDMQRMAVAMGVLTKLHLALIAHDDAREQLRLSRGLLKLRNQRASAANKQLASGKLDPGAALEAELAALFARLRVHDAIAQLRLARQRVLHAVGRDPEVGAPPAEEPAAE